jgi:hypothetical protein
VRLDGTRKSYGCEPAHGVLFDNGLNVVTTSTQAVNESLSLRVVRNSHSQVSVSCEPRFGTCGNGQPANQCEIDASFSEIDMDLA